MKTVFPTLLLIFCPHLDTVGSLVTVMATEKRPMTLSVWQSGTTLEEVTCSVFQKCVWGGDEETLSLEALERSPSMNGALVPRRSPRA